MPEKYNQNKFVNRSYVIDEKGNIDSFYDKINLFDVKLNDYEYYYESKNYVSGKKLWYQTYQLENLDYQFAMILDSKII